MTEPRRLLVVVAHPDDETFGCGSVIALAAQRGVEVTVCCATRGEAGAPPPSMPARATLADVREDELRVAAGLLGVARVVLLGFADSGMDGEPAGGTLAAAPVAEVARAVLAVVEETRPDTVVTLDPCGGDGHRDHVAIGRATTMACASMPDVALYYWALPRDVLARWFEELERARPDSEHLDLDRAGLGRPAGEITTVIDTASVMEQRERAIAAHASQVSPYDGMSEGLRRSFLTADGLVRVNPPWSGGPVERSLL